MENPSQLAKSIASLLRRDPVTAQQIREHFRSNELQELLGIPPEVVAEEVTREVVLSYAAKYIPLADIIDYFNNAQHAKADRARSLQRRG